MGHEGIKLKKDEHGSPRSYFSHAPVTSNENTPQSPLIQHHRNIGNQAVQRLMEVGAVQAKLKIGQPNDKYEQEADRVTEQVMRMPEPNRTLVQRKPT